MLRIQVTAFCAITVFFSALVVPADAAWVAYNDFMGTPMANNTNYGSTSPAQGFTHSGLLINYATGLPLATATLSIGPRTPSGGNSSDQPGNMPNSGTPAYILFNGFVNANRSYDSKDASPSEGIVLLTGLDSTKTYDVALLTNRTGGDDRPTRSVISDVTSFINIGDPSTKSTTNVTDDTITIPFDNNVNGYLHRWTSIVPGGDGDIQILLTTVGGDGGNDWNAIRIEELGGAAVPEPSTWALGLLGLAGLGVVAWKKRRK